MSELPTMNRAKPIVEAVTQTAPIAPECELVSMTFPVFQWDSGYVRQKLDVMLTGAQAATLKSIQLGLEKQEAKLTNGRCVSNPVDAIRWMLENAAENIA